MRERWGLTSNIRPLALLDADQFVDLLTEYYDKLETDYKALVPLRKVWVPAQSTYKALLTTR